MNLIIFEDEFTDDLYPFSQIRPVFDLKCGMISLKERILRELPVSNVILWVRNHLVPVTRENNPDFIVNELYDNEKDYFSINGTLLFNEEYKNVILNNGNTIFKKGDRVLAANIKYSDTLNLDKKLDPSKTIGSNNEIFSFFGQKGVDFVQINYWWDLVHKNPEMLEKDFRFFEKGGTVSGKVYSRNTKTNT